VIRLGLGKCNCFERGQERSILRIPLGRKRRHFSAILAPRSQKHQLLTGPSCSVRSDSLLQCERCILKNAKLRVLFHKCFVYQRNGQWLHMRLYVLYIYTHYITLHCIALHYITLHYFTYTHTCMHACIHPYTHTSIHACMHTYTYAYIIICIIICNIFGWNLILWNNLYRDRQMNKEE
jgi:hypothetical protein